MPDSSYNQFCPVAMAAEVLGARWTLLLLRELVSGSTRFNDLRRGVPRMSPALLSKRLKELETAGIVSRAPVSGEPGLYEYRLTEAGRELKPVIEAIGCWGQRWIDLEASLEKLDPNLLMWDMRRNINPTPMPPSRSTIQVIFTDLPEDAAKLVAGRRARPGGGLVLGRPGVRRRSLPVDRLADDDRDLDGLHHDRAGQGAGEAAHHRQQAARGRYRFVDEPEPVRAGREESRVGLVRIERRDRGRCMPRVAEDRVELDLQLWNDLCRSAASCHGKAKRGGRAARRAGLGQARTRRADGRDLDASLRRGHDVARHGGQRGHHEQRLAVVAAEYAGKTVLALARGTPRRPERSRSPTPQRRSPASTRHWCWEILLAMSGTKSALWSASVGGIFVCGRRKAERSAPGRVDAMGMAVTNVRSTSTSVVRGVKPL